MSDPSSSEPLKSAVWDRKLANNDAARCTAHRKNGERCRKFSIFGSTVCRTHGGAAKQVRNAARARIANAADLMAKQLLKIATDDDVNDAVKLAAVRDALDRAGLGIRAGVDIEISAKPFEQIITNVESGSRADYRRSQGIADDSDSIPPARADRPAALRSADSEPIDAEIVDPIGGEDLIAAMAMSHVNDADDPTGHDDAERRPSAWLAGNAMPASHMMPMDEAVQVVAEMQRQAAAQRQADAVARREEIRRDRDEQRALPPGRS